MARRPEGITKNVATIGGKTYTYFRARISRPGYNDGKRQRESKSFDTEAAAIAWLREKRKETPRAAGENLTVQQWVKPWLDGKERQLKPKSRQRAEGIFENHINPIFGNKRLDRVTVDDVLDLLKAIRRKGLDANKVYMVGRSAFDDAKKRNKVPYNVFENVETPAPRKTKTETLSEDQCMRLLATINGDPLSPLFTLALVTGMRLGEVLGLTWDRVDLEHGRIEVRQALQWLKDEYAYVDGKLHEDILRPVSYRASRNGATKPYLLTPKTANSDRDIFLAPRLVAILKAHRVKQGQRFGVKPNGPVFLTDQGTPYRHENVERALDEYVEKAGLPRVTPKGLRHSQNNFQRAVGVEAVTRAAGMGHLASVNLDVYSRATESELRRTAELSARLIPA
jgi:integrase